MNWHEISKGTSTGRTLATKLLADAGKLVPVDVGSHVINIDVNVESSYSGATSVYRVFPNGAVDKGSAETATEAVEFFFVLTMTFFKEGAFRTETLADTLTVEPGDDMEGLYWRAQVLFEAKYHMESFGSVKCWTLLRNALD